MLVKEFIGKLNSFNMDAKIKFYDANGVECDPNFIIDEGKGFDEGNTENLTVQLKAAETEETEQA